jgi:hypothetical protein
MAIMGTPSSRSVAACPEGHAEGLVLRWVVDVPVVGPRPDGSGLEVDEKEFEVQEGDGVLGVDGGVWCPACEQWYEEEECVQEKPTRRRVAP